MRRFASADKIIDGPRRRSPPGQCGQEEQGPFLKSSQGVSVIPEGEFNDGSRNSGVVLGPQVVAANRGDRRLRRDVRPAAAEGTDAAPSPAPPELRRVDERTIEIRHDFFHRSGYRPGSEEDTQALFDCLEQGIKETFEGGTEGWSRRRVREETQRIENECRNPVLPVPVPPRPPQPGN